MGGDGDSGWLFTPHEVDERMDGTGRKDKQ